jgi:hypothetical protein
VSIVSSNGSRNGLGSLPVAFSLATTVAPKHIVACERMRLVTGAIADGKRESES